jgi:hypothetical protein
MGEFLDALVAIPSIRRLGIVRPYENMGWSIAAAAKSCSVFLARGVLLPPIYWTINKSYRLFDPLTVLLSHRTDDLVMRSNTRNSPEKVVIAHHVSFPREQRAVYAI